MMGHSVPAIPQNGEPLRGLLQAVPQVICSLTTSTESPIKWALQVRGIAMMAIGTRLRAARAAIQNWLLGRREAELAAQVRAEAFIRRYGPEDAYLAARQLKRKARSRREAAHWRRVARAVARMTQKPPDGDTTMVD